MAFVRQASAQTLFSKDLTIGMSGSDVKELQILLNQDPATAVAVIGPGSPGNETSYFGQKTEAAAVEFQEKYAADILMPIGMTQGTGYVGARTRAKLEALVNAGSLSSQGRFESTATGSALPITSTNAPIKNIPVPLASAVPSTATVSVGSTSSIAVQSKGVSSLPALQSSLSQGVIAQQNAFQAVSPNDLLIFGLSHDKIKPGDSLSVTGFGFDPGTIAHIGQFYSIGVAATSSDSFAIQIPATISYGSYDFWVSNSRGTSMGKSPFKLTIADTTDRRPNLISVSPTIAVINDAIVVTADKLDFSGNAVYSNLGIIRSVPSSDGKSMSFKVSQLPNASALLQSQSIDRFTVTFGIRTATGQSLNYGYFTLTK